MLESASRSLYGRAISLKRGERARKTSPTVIESISEIETRAALGANSRSFIRLTILALAIQRWGLMLGFGNARERAPVGSMILMDNGPEFTSKAFNRWAY